MEEKGANVRRKSEKRKPPRARREKILNYRKWPRGPCCNSMNCVTYRNVIRTSPGGAYAHMRTHDGEIEVPTLVPSHRHVKNGVTTGKITRCVGNPKKVLQNGKDRRRQKSNANNRVKKRGKSKKIQGRKGKKG